MEQSFAHANIWLKGYNILQIIWFATRILNAALSYPPVTHLRDPTSRCALSNVKRHFTYEAAFGIFCGL